MFTTRDPDEPRVECLVLRDQQLPIVDHFVSSVNSESPESVKLIYSKYLPPATKLGQGYVLQASVILLTGGRGVPHPPCPPEADTPGLPPPREQTPRSRHHHPPSRHPPRSRHSPGADPAGADTPPQGEHAERHVQRAGGTHPTGIQSCLKL